VVHIQCPNQRLFPSPSISPRVFGPEGNMKVEGVIQPMAMYMNQEAMDLNNAQNEAIHIISI